MSKQRLTDNAPDNNQAEIQPNLLELAMQSHQAGNFSQAEALYRQILQTEPNNADALHYLGVLAYQLGQSSVAIGLIHQAIDIYPASSAMYCNLGLALQAAGKVEAAMDSYHKALLLQPNYSEAFYNFGNALQTQGKLAEAVDCYRKTLALQPDYLQAYVNLGNLLLAQQQIEAGIEMYRQALFFNPDLITALEANLTGWLKQFNKSQTIIENYQQQLTRKPNSAEQHYQCGLNCYQQNNHAAAVYHYKEAIGLKPDYAEAYYAVAMILIQQEYLDAAIENLQQAIALKADYLLAYNALAEVLKEQDKTDAALACYQKALLIEPNCADSHYGLGNLYYYEAELKQAVDCYQQALLSNPNHAEAYYRLGSLFNYQAQFAQAVKHYENALKINPQHIEARLELGIVQLYLGDFSAGWRNYEARYAAGIKNSNTVVPYLPFPQWQGQSLSEKSVLVWYEQGFGDEIQFCRYVSELKKQGARQISWVGKKPLKGLLNTLRDVDNVFAQDEVALIAAHDYWTFPLSIPLQCKTTVETIPASVPYLYADAERVAKFALQLTAIKELKVGICWQGNPTFKGDLQRSPGIIPFNPLFKLSGVKFFTLQPETLNDFIQVTGNSGMNIGREIDKNTFEDAAALIANLDLVISSDTSICHLAGALGKEVWIVLPVEADWRWLRQGESSPWYPTARLFRQTKAGDWTEVFQRIKTQLKNLLNNTPIS